MTTSSSSSSESANSAADLGARRQRWRKIRAVLAAGVVVGIGATVTLAAWNDSEHATGSFAAGSFNLEGSTDGTAYADHASGANAAALSFTANPTNMAPGDVEYAPFAVRLAAGTTTGASVALQAVTNTGTVTNLTYTLVRTTSATCNAAAVSGGTAVVPAGTALTSIGTPTAFTLAKGANTTTAGAPQYLCFAVTAGAGLVQGQSGTATWQFQATSTS